MLGWLGLTDAPDFRRARPLGALVGVVLILLFVGALVAAFVTLFSVVVAPAGTSLGAGALIVAILSAPFLIWGTIIKHRALGFQKEGHLTDRISKAVEQLGAEKTVSYIARNVTRQARPPEQREAGETDWVDQLQKLDRASLTHDRIVEEGAGYNDWQVFSETVPNIEVRIGGILSLERIAQDSTAYDHGRDHVRVMEILCAYVRENAPASGAKDHEFGDWVPLKDDPTEAEHAAHLENRQKRFGERGIYGLVYQWARTLPPPREDIALALRVIGRRTAKQRLAEAAWPDAPDASTRWVFDAACPSLPDDPGEAALSQATLADFRAKLNAWKTDIRAFAGYRPDLRSTNLQGADLSGLTLSGAQLFGARMEGANLSLARMEGADLRGARMEGAYFGRARMEGADLGEARMEGAYLGSARMEEAELRGAQMEEADLTAARMEGADLRGARMEGADLSRARMERANLGWARMEGADLRGARMGVGGAAISQKQINSAFGDGSTILPPTLTRPAHWPVHTLLWNGSHTEWHKWRASPATYTPPPAPSGA
jgi:uncharacterized protein YjbI with pentapeptide repeats